MGEKKTLPPLGPDGEEERICHRFTGFRPDGSWIPCGLPAVAHVFWTEENLENGYACAEHRDEIGLRWSYWRMHGLGADCGMPGALFYPDENVCRCEELPTTVETEAHEPVGVS